MEEQKTRRKRLPDWMRMQMPEGQEYSKVKNLVKKHQLHTICTSGTCPNIGECWNRGTATFMILGDICTRSCKFCGVKTGKPAEVDFGEPKRVARSVTLMGLKHAVITSVDRDDLEDGGAAVWKETILEVRRQNPGTSIEVLIPDFRGREKDIQQVIDARPEVISHNIETVERLTKQIRSAASYQRSLKVIGYIAESGLIPKSGIMLGLGEQPQEVLQTMRDLLSAGCRVLTIGQYLQPGPDNWPVQEYIHPDTFEEYRKKGLEMGFSMVESSPLVRSSYNAEKHVNG